MSRSAELLTGQLNRFERLLADLLEISRYDARAATLEPDTVDLVGLVHSLAEAFAPAAAQAGTRIDVLIDPASVTDGLLLAEVDPRRVARVLRNLLANAIDYAEGSPVELLMAASPVGEPNGTVAIRVRDHGAGLKPGERERVFDRFWRADPSRSRATGGTGLGLSIALEDARLHGGELAVWGRPGEGASFRLLLPRHAGEPLGASPLELVPEGLSPADVSLARIR